MSARFAILGLLVEQPRHGYALDRVIEERGMRTWSDIGFSSIYWVLDRLVADGLAEVQEIQTTGRSGGRKVFRASEAGVRAWHDDAIAALGDFGRPMADFLAALSGLPGLEPAEARAALERRLVATERRLAEMIEDREHASSPIPPHVAEMFAFGEATLKAQRDWLAGFLADRWQADGLMQEVDR